LPVYSAGTVPALSRRIRGQHPLPHRRIHAAGLGHGLNPVSRAGCAWTAKHGSRLPVPVSLRPLGCYGSLGCASMRFTGMLLFWRHG